MIVYKTVPMTQKTFRRIRRIVPPYKNETMVAYFDRLSLVIKEEIFDEND